MIIRIREVSIELPKRGRRSPEYSDITSKFFKQFGGGEKAIEKLMEVMRKKIGENFGEGESEATHWGEMNVKRPILTKSERHHSFRHRYSYVGPFRYPHRALLPISDGRAWHHRAAGKGGTLLIDCSGSMSLRNEQILEVLKNNPLATVAVYYGAGDNQTGDLTVLAAHNRYAAGHDYRAHHYGGGNVVDYPALSWLAHQERPRIWVCDGIVTGVNDAGANLTMLKQVATILLRADIRWLRHVSQIPKGKL